MPSNGRAQQVAREQLQPPLRWSESCSRRGRRHRLMDRDRPRENNFNHPRGGPSRVRDEPERSDLALHRLPAEGLVHTAPVDGSRRCPGLRPVPPRASCADLADLIHREHRARGGSLDPTPEPAMPPDIPAFSFTLVLCLTACSPEPRVIAARRDLPAGSLLTLGDLVDVKRPVTHEPDDVIPVRHSASIIGAYLKDAVPSGAPLPSDCCERLRVRDRGSTAPHQRRLVTSRRASRWACRHRPPGRR